MARDTRLLAAGGDARFKAGQRSRWRGRSLIAHAVCVAGVAGFLVALGGCGTSFNELLFQSGSAVGRSVIDQALSDVLNQLAGLSVPTGGGGVIDTAGGGTGGGGTSGGGTTGGNPGALTGDAPTGQTVFTANGCAGCHCDDASGGCALSAPPIIASDVVTIDDFVRGAATHPVKPPVSDQDVADLAAWLATL